LVSQTTIRQAHTSRAVIWDEAAALLGSLDALRSAITIFDADGRLLYANAHLNYLLRSLPPHETLIGRSYEDMIRMEIEGGEIAPSALAGGVPVFVAQRLAQLAEGAFAPQDVPLADLRVMELKARRGKDGRTVLLWSDVTAARAQLARLEEAVALSAEAFAFFDSSDRMIMGNALYAHLCGYKSLTELKGLTFTEIASRVAHSGRIMMDETPEKWLERRLKGHRQQAGAGTFQTNTGECYLVRDRPTSDGGRVIIFTDVTDRFRAERALAEQQDALAAGIAQTEKQSSYLADLTKRLDAASAKVDSAKTTLLRTMGHELKTPLNAVLGFSDLMATLADNLNPTQIREYAGLIHQGGSNLLKMITQIMDLTKIAAGRYDLRRTTVDAGSVLWLAREAFAVRAESRGITIDASRCPVGVMGDADEAVFTAMVQSLVDNAVTFTPTGGTVTLSVSAGASGIAVTVEDNGIGVAPEDLARIQEPFEHAGRGEEHSKGAGLGLTLVKAFAELHDGRLELASVPGKGFKATVTLPLARLS
jgi:two-component system cell cycle sensor histidine kinase PleC